MMQRFRPSALGRVVAAGSLATLVAGCMLGPNFRRPALSVPEAWREVPLQTVVDASTIANTPWWDIFRDPVLTELIQIALAENQDLRIAIERIIEARARVGVVRSELFPQIDLGANAGSFEQSRESFPQTRPPIQNDAELFDLSADLTWEIDVFGRIRRSTEAELARLAATEEVRRAVTIALVASVARAYVELRDFDERLAIARETLASRAQSVSLTRARFQGGLTSEKDAYQAEAEYRRVEVTVFLFEQLVRQKENELSVLIGRNPGDIARGRPLMKMWEPSDVPAGLPSELLDRRPDLLAAEERLHAATADIGAAKALLFPRIALTAGYGTASAELDALFTGSSQAWSVAAGVLQPIFNAGRNRRRVEIAESVMRQSLYDYELTVHQAFREVDDGLIAYEKTGSQRGAQYARVASERRVVELSQARYEGGVADYLEVLDAQRSLFSAELDAVQTAGEHMIALIQLYKALGGGWPPSQPVPVPPA